MKNFDIQAYMTNGVEKIVKEAIKATLNNPKESIFMLKFATASKHKNILFPLFTNGTFINGRYFELFDQSRNLLPIMSIEGGQKATDARRGAGIYDTLVKNMDEIKRRGLVFGTSVTVTTANIKEVASADIAAGRGFFHINSHGGAEPCPFSPYSDFNIREQSLIEALKSPLFAALRSGDILLDEHNGGCVLHTKKAEVEAILEKGV